MLIEQVSQGPKLENETSKRIVHCHFFQGRKLLNDMNKSITFMLKVVCVIFAQLKTVFCAIFYTDLNLNCGRMWAFSDIIHKMVSKYVLF